MSMRLYICPECFMKDPSKRYVENHRKEKHRDQPTALANHTLSYIVIDEELYYMAMWAKNHS